LLLWDELLLEELLLLWDELLLEELLLLWDELDELLLDELAVLDELLEATLLLLEPPTPQATSPEHKSARASRVICL
jgi:hypothetical protein